MYANYHTHTMRCQHASGHDREYVEAAIRAGYDTLGFSDHCPWVYPDNFVSGIRMSAAETDGYFNSLLSLRKEYEGDIRILIGFEAEYMPPLMEAQERLLAEYPLDYMILGQHFVGPEGGKNYAGNRTNSEKMLTGYVDLCLAGAQTGKYMYLAHPDLIYYTGDTKIYEREMTRLCRGAKKLSLPLEINVLGIAGGRNYPNPLFWKIAAKTGNQVITGMDAHAPEQLENPPAVLEAERLIKGMERFIPQAFVSENDFSKNK